MAGIGFALQRLSRRGDILGIVAAYVHAALASSAPWLFTIMALAAVIIYAGPAQLDFDMLTIRMMIIYNFAFSLVLTSPFYMVITRHISNLIYTKQIGSVSKTLLHSLFWSTVFQLPVVGFFYFTQFEISLTLAVLATVNYMAIAYLWVVMVYLSALKDFTSVAVIFGIGMALAGGLSIALLQEYGPTGLLFGFTVGVVVIVFMIIAKVFHEYPSKGFDGGITMRKTYWRYRDLALSATLYNAAIWSDKWVMWAAPEAITLPTGFAMNIPYDSAMFLAYLTVVPALALFVFSVETNFYPHYLAYIRSLQGKKTGAEIQKFYDDMMANMFKNTRNFIVLQGVICALVILGASYIFDVLNLSYTYLTIFRFGVLGAFFHALIILLSVLTSYFEMRKQALYANLFFFLANTGLAYYFMSYGPDWYGFGYALACIATFAFAAILLLRSLKNLTWYIYMMSARNV